MLIDNALITLDAIKPYLDIEDNSKDIIIEDLINSASTFVEKYTCRKFNKQSYNESYEGSGTNKLVLKQYPIITLTDGADLTILHEEGILIKSGIWHKGKTYKIEYTAGFDIIPFDLQMLVKELVVKKFLILTNPDGALALKKFNISDVSWEWDKDLTKEQLQILSLYKKVKI